MKTIAVLQPGYLPWLGFFDQMAQSQVFVIYDDVQYDKHGWRNRNRIRTASGIEWLTVPVLAKGRSGQKIKEVQINNKVSWREKHLKTIHQHYKKSPFLNLYFPKFKEILCKDWDLLLSLDMAVINAIVEFLGIKTKILFSSQIGIDGIQTERLIKICKSLHAQIYLTGDKARDYLDEMQFKREGLLVTWHQYQHPIYTQCYEPFVPYLSVIDLLFNHGTESLDILSGRRGANRCLQSSLPAVQGL